jgi:hypothetical protein
LFALSSSTSCISVFNCNFEGRTDSVADNYHASHSSENGFIEIVASRFIGNGGTDAGTGIFTASNSLTTVRSCGISGFNIGKNVAYAGVEMSLENGQYTFIHGNTYGVYVDTNGYYGMLDSQTVYGKKLNNSTVDANTTDKFIGTSSGGGLESNGTILLKPSGDTDDFLTFATVSGIPTIYGTGSYSRFGDASATSHSLASEDDLMVSGKLEVDGGIYDDSVMGTSLAKLITDNTLTMPVMDTNTNIQILLTGATGTFDLGTNVVKGNLHGESGAYLLATGASDSTKIVMSAATFDNTILSPIFGNWVKWASNAAGDADTGEGYATYVSTTQLNLYTSSGADFANGYYFWIRKSYYVAPVSGYYQITYFPVLDGCEDGKRYNGTYIINGVQNTYGTQVTGQASFSSSRLRLIGTDIVHLTAGDKVSMIVGNTLATAATCYVAGTSSSISIRCIKLD